MTSAVPQARCRSGLPMWDTASACSAPMAAACCVVSPAPRMHVSLLAQSCLCLDVPLGMSRTATACVSRISLPLAR